MKPSVSARNGDVNGFEGLASEDAARARDVLLEHALAELGKRLARPPLTVKPQEAAALLGCSRDFFDATVLSEIRVVRRGRLVLVPVRELERWVERSAAVSLKDELR